MTRAPATVDKSHAIAPLTPPPVPATPSNRKFLLPSTTSPRNAANRLWAQAHQRRTFLKHLKQWSLSHDSSTHFQGKVSLLPPNQNRIEELALGKSVQCVLTDSSFTDFRKKIVVRLFGPQMASKSKEQSAIAAMKKDSMDAYDGRGRLAELEVDMLTSIKDDKTQSISQTGFSPSSRYYKLVIRCGSGWLTARDYLNRFYLTHLAARNPGPNASSILKGANQTFSTRSQALGPQPAANDTVTIQPLFHPFLRLPQELQEMIWMTAAGLTKDYDLCPETRLRVHPKHIKSPISLSTLLRISPSITATMQPYILRRTAFHFGLTGTTNFLWQSGPVNRSHVQRLAFHFGRGALLHCVRWLAPDEIFDLLQPPVQREMGGLPFFWRAQLRAMAKEVHLRELIIDLRAIRQADVAMVARILKELFGSVERVSFVETDYLGAKTVVAEGDVRLKELDMGASWRELTRGYVDRYRMQVGWHNYHFRLGIADMSDEELNGLMDKEGAFFDS